MYVGERILEQLPEVYQKKLLPEFYFYPIVAPTGVRIRLASSLWPR